MIGRNIDQIAIFGSLGAIAIFVVVASVLRIFYGGDASSAFQIARLLITPVFFFIVTLSLIGAAIWVDSTERSLASQQLTAVSQPPAQGDVRWRSLAVASLAVITLGATLLSLGGLGKIRQKTTFDVVDYERRYSVALWAPLLATQNEPVAVDAQVTVHGEDALKPRVTYGCDTPNCAETSIDGAIMEDSNAYFWRFIVKFAETGFETVDIRLKNAEQAPLKTQLVTIDVVPSFGLSSISTSSTAIAGIITTIFGIIGSIIAFLRGQKSQ